jgi:1-aminocyclopropane-1-carboxylate deaminase/D-cysteine desulfhydrase-like pyridoxal-dependent ACC family enzyme
MLQPLSIPLTFWENDIFKKTRLKVYLARLDLIHPDYGGNKYFKLLYNIEQMYQQNKDTLVTFGGAYSNHIWATAAVGHHWGIKTIGYIRGEETNPLNDVLAQARAWGMELRYVNRTDYRTLKTGEVSCLPNEYVLPEGGSNSWAVKGCSEILTYLETSNLPTYQYVCVPCGTGATLAGLIASQYIKAPLHVGEERGVKLVGISALKGGDFLKNDVKTLLQQANITNTETLPTWDILTQYHFGGYAKTTQDLKIFAQNFAKQYFVLDEVYTAKMLFAIEDLAQNGYFSAESTVVALITQRQNLPK